MFAIELSTSIDWAREMRGTASTASAVMRRVASDSTRSGRRAGLSMPTTVASSASREISSRVGASTFSTTSLAHASSAPTIPAPASRYASSANDAALPAPFSTTTSYPSAASCFTVLGVAATRASPARSATTPRRATSLSLCLSLMPW